MTTGLVSKGAVMHMSHLDAVKVFIAAAMIGLIGVLPSAAFAQATKKPIRVGLIAWANVEQRGSLEVALTEGLREQGYVEGKNLSIERRYVIGDGTKLDESARQLAGLQLDAIVTTCSPSTKAVKQATSSTPIVMAAVSDPVNQHLIASLAKPGQNITGLSSQSEDLLPKMLEFLASVLSRPAATIAVFVHTTNPVHSLMWQKLEGPARQLNLKLVRVDLARGADVPAAFDAAVRAQADAIFVLPDDPMLFNNRVRIVGLATENHMPGFYWASEFVEAGGLISYGENQRGTYRNAAKYIAKIVTGENPGVIPVAQPTRFELVVNRKTAKELGITIPQPILVLADRVID